MRGSTGTCAHIHSVTETSCSCKKGLGDLYLKTNWKKIYNVGRKQAGISLTSTEQRKPGKILKDQGEKYLEECSLIKNRLHEDPKKINFYMKTLFKNSRWQVEFAGIAQDNLLLEHLNGTSLSLLIYNQEAPGF